MINESHYASDLIRVSLIILSLFHVFNVVVVIEFVFWKPCVILWYVCKEFCDRLFKKVGGGLIYMYGKHAGSNPGKGDCVVFMGRALFYLHSVSSCWRIKFWG